MNRRRFVLSGLLVSTALVPAHAQAKVQLIYVGGWDCPYCIDWKNGDKAAWLASPEYKRVTYTEIDVPKLREAYESRYWQGDLKPILAQLPRKSGTPRFLVVKDGQVVSNQFGTPGWRKAYADLKKALG